MTKITIFGGDARMRTAYEQLKEMGYAVDSLGLYENDCADCTDSKVFLLPVPATRDRRTICTPLTSKIIPLSYIEQTAGDRLVLSGVYKPQVKNCINYCETDGYAIKNAVPTAEGAIAIAIEKTDFTLFGSRVLVIGYGRTGRVLCDRLKGLGCIVTAAARKDEALALAQALGLNTIHTKDISKNIGTFDIIFNTADAPLLQNCKTDALIIDLSTTGCIDETLVSTDNYNYCKAPSLPGKTAPRSAGIILAQTISQIIEQHIK
ncbi:MAG: hypothetical protein E7562_06975 [Ruminococcaceae bacterium]|nr:hypothetical protein [Oscillospiraceae bacterium]